MKIPNNRRGCVGELLDLLEGLESEAGLHDVVRKTPMIALGALGRLVVTIIRLNSSGHPKRPTRIF